MLKRSVLSCPVLPRLLAFGTLTCLLAAGGCSVTGAAFEAVRLGKNTSSKDSYLRIWVDGNEAKQNKLKKAYFGHASFKVKETVSTRPVFRFDFIEPARFGRITGTSMQIHQEFEADYSHQAEFVITPTNPNDSETLMRPNVDYNLGAVPSNLQVLDFHRNNVPGIELKPGLDYLLVFTVAGDRSETIQVLISTR